MNRELEIRERVALYGLELTGHDREALYIARGNLEFYAYSDLRYLLSENARLRADLAAMTAERDAMRERAEAAVTDVKLVADARVCSDQSEICMICKHDLGEDCGGCWRLDHELECEFEWRGPDVPSKEDKP